MKSHQNTTTTWSNRVDRLSKRAFQASGEDRFQILHGRQQVFGNAVLKR